MLGIITSNPVNVITIVSLDTQVIFHILPSSSPFVPKWLTTSIKFISKMSNILPLLPLLFFISKDKIRYIFALFVYLSPTL